MKRYYVIGTQLLLCFVVIIGFYSCEATAKSFERYQIIEVAGVADFDDDILYSKLGVSNADDEDFEIIYRNKFEGTAQFLVKPDLVTKFNQEVTKNRFTSKVLLEDIESVIQLSKNLRANSEDLNSDSTFDRYMDYLEIQKYLLKLQKTHSYKVKLTPIGRSIRNESITMVTITDGVRRRNSDKPVIFIEAGIHAREWISVASALYAINELVKGARTDLTKSVEWRIVPVTNPDGYKYTWTTNRLWRKNLRRNQSGGRCSGVDLNRNFDSHWRVSGSSKRECSQIYAGRSPFSEPETRAIRDAFLNVKDRIKTYVSVHSYGQFILLPPSHSDFSVNESCSKILYSIGAEMAEAIRNLTKAEFTHGAPSKLLYPASGTSMDWAYANGNTPLVYTFELRDTGSAGFLLPEQEIYSGVTEFWDAVNILYEKVVRDAKITNKSPTGECAQYNSNPTDVSLEIGARQLPYFKRLQYLFREEEANDNETETETETEASAEEGSGDDDYMEISSEELGTSFESSEEDEDEDEEEEDYCV